MNVEQLRRILKELIQEAISIEYHITTRNDIKKRWDEQNQAVQEATNKILNLDSNKECK